MDDLKNTPLNSAGHFLVHEEAQLVGDMMARLIITYTQAAFEGNTPMMRAYFLRINRAFHELARLTADATEEELKASGAKQEDALAR